MLQQLLNTNSHQSILKRGQALLMADDVAEQMQHIAPLEAYLMIKELGLDDALPMIVHATPEQIQTCIDLDCWEHDDLQLTEVDAWLSAVANQGDATLAAFFLNLEEDVQILFLAQRVKIYDIREDDIPELPAGSYDMQSRDSFFMLHTINPELEDDNPELDIFTLINALYDNDCQHAYTLLMAAKWELVSTTQEQAFQYRCGRMEDLGFPDLETANKLFNKPPLKPPLPTGLRAPHDNVHLPSLYATALHATSLLTSALASMHDTASHDRLETELVYVINAAIVAYGSKPKDLQHVTDIANRVHAMLCLGLEALLVHHQQSLSIENAVGILTQWPLVHIFQWGYQTLQPLRHAALDTMQHPRIQAWLEGNHEHQQADKSFLQHLATKHPVLAGADYYHPHQTRGITSKQDMAMAQQRLDALIMHLHTA